MADILVRAADPYYTRHKRPWSTAPGPRTLLLEIKCRDADGFRNWRPGIVVECASLNAARHVQAAVERLMADLHNTRLTPPDPDQPPPDPPI